jgi:hypothetical protein
MASAHRKNQLRLALEIQRNGFTSPIECDYCLLHSKVCIIMPGGLKCSECTRIGRPCVNMSWESLDRTRDEYSKKVEADEALLAEVVLRLMRNKKILKQAEERAKKKTICLSNEMREAGEEVDATGVNLDCPAASIGVAFSPTMWSTLGMIDESVATLGVDPSASEASAAAADVVHAVSGGS